MYLGIDLGTSGVKVVLLNDNDQVVATHTEVLSSFHPKPLWSEQNPEDWWQATGRALTLLNQQHSLREVRAIGLTGQMHGAVLLNAQGEVLRPAILWNDGRCSAECLILKQKVPDIENITGNLVMPGMTAPKLLWVAKHEPEIFQQIAHILLPKDYLRWRLTGVFATDVSDASGTLWLDVRQRKWSDVLIAACGLTVAQLPKVYESPEVTGTILDEISARWSLKNQTPVVAGAGDNAAGALGVGVWRPGDAMLSLGTSGVYFVVSDGFYSNPQQAVHSFCHALPRTWHLMSVMLSAASCLDWAAAITGRSSVSELLSLAETVNTTLDSPYFLPYLSGERTPHNNPYATGAFIGLTQQHGAAELAMAVLEGVSLGLAEGMKALHHSGVQPTSITLIGGGAKSEFWRQLLADVSGQALEFRTGGDIGPALGAARLAKVSCHQEQEWDVHFPRQDLVSRYTPDPEKGNFYQKRLAHFQQLYRKLNHSSANDE